MLGYPPKQEGSSETKRLVRYDLHDSSCEVCIYLQISPQCHARIINERIVKFSKKVFIIVLTAILKVKTPMELHFYAF